MREGQLVIISGGNKLYDGTRLDGLIAEIVDAEEEYVYEVRLLSNGEEWWIDSGSLRLLNGIELLKLRHKL
jgi:hypothetical protein